jgi:2-oxoglutarate dehydrogenase E1 component
MEQVNMQVAYCSTSANYFHVLRRQLRRGFRKPLILMMSKKLLRFKEATSDIEDFKEGLRFRRVIVDKNKEQVADDKVKRVILCSGQVYYDIEAARKMANRNDIQIIRLEQLCPFPFSYVIPEI